MKKTAVFAGLILFINLNIWASDKTKQQVTHDQMDTSRFKALRELYFDDDRFNALSGAARLALERRFGLKARKPFPLPNAPSTASASEIVSAFNNVLANTDGISGTQSETTIVLGSGSNLVVAYNDSGASGNGFTGYAFSSDSGDSFTDGGDLPLGEFGNAGDPVLARDDLTGRIYLITIINPNPMLPGRIQVFHSDDDGVTFQDPINGAPGFSEGDFLDKPWVTVDNFEGLGQGNVYLVFRQFINNTNAGSIFLTRSIDGGNTWTTENILITVNGIDHVQGPFVTVGPDHAVYVYWFEQSNDLSAFNTIRMRKSTDQGTTFNPPVTLATLNTKGDAVNGDLNLKGGFRSNSFPQAAVNPITGDIYVVYNDDPDGTDASDIFLVQSDDNGATWSDPIKVNDDTTTNDQFMPAIAVTPDGSKVFIGFYDRRLDVSNDLINRFGVIGEVIGSTINFGVNFPYSNQSFPVVIGQDPIIRSAYMGDYDQVVADNDFFYSTWGDNRTGDPDVRFARIPVSGPEGGNLALAPVSINGGNGNGAIDFNECNTLFIELLNGGSSTVSGITATLTSSTPGISILGNTSSYPDIPPNETRPNIVAFQLATSPGFDCSQQADIMLEVSTTSDGDFSLPFVLGATKSKFESNTQVPIFDFSTASSSIAVSGVSGAIAKVSVSLFVEHEFPFDTIVQLTSPDGTVITLSERKGCENIEFCDVLGLGRGCSPEGNRLILDDSANQVLVLGAKTLSGFFRPDMPLSTFNGKSGGELNGIWTLTVADDLPGFTGFIHCWSLEITSCGDGIITCPGPNLRGYWTTLFGTFNTSKLQGRFAVRNDGTKHATSFDVSLYLSDDRIFDDSDTLLMTTPISGLGAGRTQFIDMNLQLPAGLTSSGKFGIGVIDIDNAVPETDELNNQAAFGPIP